MRGGFLWRNRVLLTSGVLLIVSLHLISTGVHPGDLAARPESAFLEIVSPIDAAFTRLSDGASSIVTDYLDLLHVREENARLRNELARVKSDRARLAELEVENRHLGELLELKDVLGANAIAANVIGSDATGLSRTLILASGSSDGLRPGMAVLANQGVVGKIIAISPHASRVLLIDDHNSALDGFDQRSRARGIVAGLVDDGLILKYADRSQDIRIGDTIVTSGLDGIFPRGLLVGTIESVHRGGPGLFLGVRIEPAVDFRQLEQVLIVTQPPPHLDDPGKELTDLRLILLFAVFVVLGLAFESAVPHLVSFRALIPNLIIILVVDLGLRHHGVLPAMLAFAMGYATDALAGSHPGLNAFMMTMVFVVSYEISTRLMVTNALVGATVVFFGVIATALATIALADGFSALSRHRRAASGTDARGRHLRDSRAVDLFDAGRKQADDGIACASRCANRL